MAKVDLELAQQIYFNAKDALALNPSLLLPEDYEVECIDCSEEHGARRKFKELLEDIVGFAEELEQRHIEESEL
tara:strand:+ start:2253 stop:2474 length:222 start_codon:yes stop_codon:yes gene_type:complete